MTKQEIEDTVSLFYPSSIKVFYVNYAGGSELTPPFRHAFVSLGITTSIKTMSELRDNLNNIDYLKATLATVRTIRNESGRYCNEVLKFGDYTQADQYKAEKASDSEYERLLDRDASLDMYEELLGVEHTDLAEKLKSTINLFDEKGLWKDMAILFDIVDGKPRISSFHKFVNYRVDPQKNAEYRIGIMVEEKKK